MKKLSKIQAIRARSSDFSYLREQADIFRSDLFSYDKSLLDETGVILNFEDFGNAPDGRFTIPYKSVDFDCFFKRNKESDRLYVLFSGARTSKDPNPLFKRVSYYNFLDGSMLNIDDPMCRIYPQLDLGWYYGTKEESYCEYISEIVEEFAKRNGIQNKNIIFFSSSGGGTASLYCACKVKNSMSVTINPQIKLSLYDYSKTFQDITSIELEDEDKYNRNDLPYLISQADGSRFLIIQNIESSIDMAQLDHFCSVIGADYHYGLTQLRPNILSWTFQAKADFPHNTQEYPAMVLAVEYLIDNFEKAAELEYLYLLMNEMWHDHCQLKKLIPKE